MCAQVTAWAARSQMNPRVASPRRFYESSDQPENRWRCESSSAALLTPFKKNKTPAVTSRRGGNVLFWRRKKKHKTAKKWPLYCKRNSSNTVHTSLNPFPCNDGWSSLKLNNRRVNHLFQSARGDAFLPCSALKNSCFPPPSYRQCKHAASRPISHLPLPPPPFQGILLP